MAASLDLLMPKLGLTMSEGTVAQWAVAEGANFTRGTSLATIETDKIASDIEAPADGTMERVLVQAGVVVSVGTPIARWVPHSLAQVPGPAPLSANDDLSTPPTRSDQPIERRQVDRNRVVATPYARRLAREAGVDLAAITGTGPNGRIKASDVNQAPASHLATQPMPAQLTSALSTRIIQSIATIDISAAELSSVAKRIGGSEIDQVDWIILALARRGVRWIGINEPADSSREVVLELPERLPISAVSGLRRNPTSKPVPPGEFALFLSPAGDGIRFFLPAPPKSWRHALGISANRHAHTVTLGLSYDCELLDHAQAHRLLADLRDLLEEPLNLMAC